VTATIMNNSEHKKAGEVPEDFSIQLEKTGKERTVELQDAVAKLENDPDERRRVQTQLLQLSRVFRDATDPIIIEDLSGTIIEMNREAEQSYGWSRDELIGKSIKVLFLPERYQIALQVRQQCLNGQEVRNWEGYRVDKYGREFPTLVTIFPLVGENGRIESIATITKDISILKKLELELRDSQRRLKEFSRKSIEALEADRKAVSRELHDSIGGNLAAIKFVLESILKKIAKAPDAAAVSLEKTILQLAETIKDCKRISANLRPEIIDDRGLLPTINWHIRRFSQHYSQIKIIQQIDVNEQEVPELLKIVIYRVIQEALTNAAAHSKADTIYIRLKKSGNYIEAEVEDNGRGFDFEEVLNPGDRMSGFGLKSMRERVEIIGGSFSLHSLSGTGTCIRIAFPVGEGRSIEFVLRMPKAQQVILMGDFNKWNPKTHPMRKDENGVWRKTVMIYPGRYEYRFWADGEWYNDPRNTLRCPNCFDSENNIIEVLS
jgi:PAS domain S-box-containing protein